MRDGEHLLAPTFSIPKILISEKHRLKVAAFVNVYNDYGDVTSAFSGKCRESHHTVINIHSLASWAVWVGYPWLWCGALSSNAIWYAMRYDVNVCVCVCLCTLQLYNLCHIHFTCFECFMIYGLVSCSRFASNITTHISFLHLLFFCHLLYFRLRRLNAEICVWYIIMVITSLIVVKCFNSSFYGVLWNRIPSKRASFHWLALVEMGLIIATYTHYTIADRHHSSGSCLSIS